MHQKAIFGVLVLFIGAGAILGQADLTGPLVREQILQDKPDWQEVIASYTPAAAAIEQLKALSRPVHVEVFLGTWCSDSKAQVSAFFKVLDRTDSPLITISCIGVPQKKEDRSPFIAGKDIQKIPTFIVTVDGLEKGRIIETPLKSIEQDLLDILAR
jgi:hypothetical protein